MSIYPTIPADYKTLKNACRKGLSTESRQYWWPVLSQVKKDTVITQYPDIEGISERLTNLVCEYFAGGAATDVTFELKTEVIMKSLRKRKEVENPELLQRLIKIISECIPQIEICFLIGSDIVSNPKRYIEANPLGHSCRLYTFVEVLKRYLPKTANSLDSIGALQPQFLNLMFVDFFRTLLPRQSVLALLDAYFLEGWRILLRYALSLIKGYKAQIKAQRFHSGEEFWCAVQASARSMSASVDTIKVESILQAIKINSFDVERPMIERLYRPMNISTANIDKLMAEGKRKREKDKKMNLPSIDLTIFESKNAFRGKGPSGTNDNNNNSGQSSSNSDPENSNINNQVNPLSNGNENVSYNSVPGGSSSGNVLTLSSSTVSSVTSRMLRQTPPVHSQRPTHESSNGGHIDSDVFTLVSGSESEKNRPLFEYMCSKSNILLLEDTSRLLQMLPPSLVFEGLELAFSTSRCGWALASLFAEVKDMRPCVLLIQTIPNIKPKKSTGHHSPTRINDENQFGIPGGTTGNNDTTVFSNSVGTSTDRGSDVGGSKNIHNTNGGNSRNYQSSHDDKEMADDDDKTNFVDDEIDHGVILGVYLPCNLSPPSTTVRGDPEAFVFRLTDGLINPTTGAPLGNKGVKFTSQLLGHKGSRHSTSLSPLPTSGSDNTAILNQFAVCASSYLSFGASQKYNTNALRIDEEMRWVCSGPSDTYNSPSLLCHNECDMTQNGFLSPVNEHRRGSFSTGTYITQVTNTSLSRSNSNRPNSRSRSNSKATEDCKTSNNGDTSQGGNNIGGPPSPTPHHSTGSHSSYGHHSTGHGHINSLTVSVPGTGPGFLASSNSGTGANLLGSPMNNPLNNSNNRDNNLSLLDVDRRAGIKQIEVWCARNNYNSMISVKKKLQNISNK